MFVEKNISNIDENKYMDYFDKIYKNLNNKYEQYINSKIFDFDLSNIKIDINLIII